MSVKAFFGYPGRPQELLDNIESGIEQHQRLGSNIELMPWEAIDGPSTPVMHDIHRGIRESKFCLFDITMPNENVYYEIGYAAGLGKPLLLLVNSSIRDAQRRQAEIGIFDTQRLKLYKSGADLVQLVKLYRDPSYQNPVELGFRQDSPAFFLGFEQKNEFATVYFAQVAGTGLHTRVHDPEEDKRLPLMRASSDILSSAGVFLSLLPELIEGAQLHNLKAYLLAGLADGAEVPRLILRYGQFQTPFDLRDDVQPIQHIREVSPAVRHFLPRVLESMQQPRLPQRSIPRALIPRISVGASAAENEITRLGAYFVETREFQRTLRGEAQIVVGRKGTGKSAIFWQTRDRLHADRGNVVVDLRPEGFQLRKLNEVIAANFSAATHQHTLTAFWEYVLYVEITHRILIEDAQLLGRDSRMEGPYAELKAYYEGEEESDAESSDFPERLLWLVQRLQRDVELEVQDDKQRILTTPEITKIIYRKDVPKLRKALFKYLLLKKKVIILVDNLDKGWTASGVGPQDLALLQGLIDASRKIQREAAKSDITMTPVIFLRDDVHELLLEAATDRGKETVVRVSWSEGETLMSLVNKRLAASSREAGVSPELSWADISDAPAQAHFNELVAHCMRRPRSLIDLVELALGFAIMAGRARISAADIKRAIASYSVDMIKALNFEIRDVFPQGDGALYKFAHVGDRLDQGKALRILRKHTGDDQVAGRLLDALIWYGFLGYIDQNGKELYVMDVGDSLPLLKARAGDATNPIMCVQPVFRQALSTDASYLL